VLGIRDGELVIKGDYLLFLGGYVMIDFACRRFDLDDIVKCGLGLTRTEFRIMRYFMERGGGECTTSSISKRMNLNLTTVQKAVKKLFEKDIILRHQKNLGNGGYVYSYECNSRIKIRKIIKGIIRNWFDVVERKMDSW